MRVVNCRREYLTHFIGRPSVFGNPFHMKTENDRERVIANFEVYARTSERVLDAIKALPEDAILGCYCKPAACHGDIIIKLWHELHGIRNQ